MGKPKTERGERLRVLEQVKCKEGVEVMKVKESLMGIKRCMYITIIAVAPLCLLLGPSSLHPFRPAGPRTVEN